MDDSLDPREHPPRLRMLTHQFSDRETDADRERPLTVLEDERMPVDKQPPALR
jgi:hypothetical protein